MRRSSPRVSLTGQVALLSLIPIVALGIVLAVVLRGQIVSRTLADATQSARLVAHLGVQPRISPNELRYGLSASGIRALDEQLRARSVTHDLARIKIWNAAGSIVYSDDHRLIAKRPGESDELKNALEGRPNAAAVVSPSADSETASEVGLGRLVEVYVPLRFTASGPPAGVFEIYLSYGPIAAAVGSDERTIAMLIVLGLALLSVVLLQGRGVEIAAPAQAGRGERSSRPLRPADGLPNRTFFGERLARALGMATSGEGVAVLLFDLDRFKQINDTLGHRAGDTVLIEVARRLRESFEPGLSVARLGNNEFAVLDHFTKNHTDALEIAARIRSTMEEPVALHGAAVNVDASIGIAIAPEHGSEEETLLRRADMALAHARSHKTIVEIYCADHDHFEAARLKLLGDRFAPPWSAGSSCSSISPSRPGQRYALQASRRYCAGATPSGGVGPLGVHADDRANRAHRRRDPARDRPGARTACGMAS